MKGAPHGSSGYSGGRRTRERPTTKRDAAAVLKVLHKAQMACNSQDLTTTNGRLRFVVGYLCGAASEADPELANRIQARLFSYDEGEP